MTRTVSLDNDLLATMTPEERAEIESADDGERTSLLAAGAAKDPRHTGGDIDEPSAGAGEGAASAAADGAAAAAAAADAGTAQTEGAAAAAADGAAAGGDAAKEAAAAAAAAAGEATQAAATPAAAPAPAPAADDPVPVGAIRPPPPAYQFELPNDFEERMTAVKAEQGSLLDRFEAGELTKEELRAEQDRLAEQRRELDSMRSRAEMAADMRQQSSEAYRQQAISTLMDAAMKPEHGGIDYRKDAAKLSDLDTFVRSLASNEANADRPLEWFLNEAHRRVRVLHGLGAAPAPAPAPAPAAAAAAPAPAKNAADTIKAAANARRPDIPNDVDLSSLPGGADASDTDGEFGDIMALEGDAFEDAIAKMARHQPERWARFQSQRQ